MENYEEKYKNALKWAKDCIKAGASGMFKEDLEHYFPELAESEDEKIRKELLKHCLNRRDGKQICVDASDYRRWAAWLEKQGEQKPFNNDIVETIKKKIIDHFDNHLLLDRCFSIGGLKNDILKIINEVKQSEQKYIDKVEPKFKVGDWITIKE